MICLVHIMGRSVSAACNHAAVARLSFLPRYTYVAPSLQICTARKQPKLNLSSFPV